MNNAFPEKCFFSVIIPTYNRAFLIEKTIRSVLSQTFLNFEVLIIDDGSTDDTSYIVSKINHPKLFYYKKNNAERAAARNYGTKLAKGNYITFLDSDDLFYKNHLENAYSTIEKNNSPEVIHTRYEIKKSDDSEIKPQPFLNNDLNKKLIKGNFMSCQGVFLRKDIAVDNLFNEDKKLSALEDWELWLRIASKYKIYYSNTITSAIINHDERSVLKTDSSELIQRVDCLLKYVLRNDEVASFYKDSIHLFKASCYSYIALHIALTKKNRLTTIKYTLKAIKAHPGFIFKRRCWAILKHFI